MDVSQLSSIVDSGWVFIAAALVFFMRAGFLALEAGLTQRKNSANVATKNLVDLAIAATCFWLYGFGLMFGKSTEWGLFGSTGFSPDFMATFTDPATRTTALSSTAFFFYQIMFANTAVVIVSGATAERLRFETYLIISAVISGLIYPFFGHWAWNGIDTGQLGGWLGSRGFVDLAGSTVVHSIGAWASLAALVVIGPRRGRFNSDGTANEFPKANLPLAVIGTFILWFGWFGFNGGSAFLTQGNVGVIVTNTLMAGIAGLVAVLPAQILLNDGIVRADYLMNGALVGLVSITASAHAVSTSGAFTIGLLGGWIMLMLDWLLIRLGIDDAVGAIPVHLGGGIWGTLAVAFYGNPAMLGTGLNFTAQFLIQLTGIIAAGAWAFLITVIILNTVNLILPLRVEPEEEDLGLNLSEQDLQPDYTEFPGLKELLAQQEAAQSPIDKAL